MRERLDGEGRPVRLRILLIGGAMLAGFVLLLCAVYFVGNWLDEAPEAIPEPLGSIEGRFQPAMTMIVDGKEYAYYDNYFSNILVMGVDREDLGDATAYRSGGQADFLMLLSIDRHHRTVTPIHIDRDTVADVRIYSPFGHAAGVNRMQICLSHAFGNDVKANCENTVWAVERLLQGVSVDEYLVLDMTGIAMLNDALGGVTVTLQEDFTHLDAEMTQGKTITLQGKQAEYFVRGRHEVGDSTNRQRMQRQRVFLEGMETLFEARVKQDPAFLVKLFDELKGHMYSSMDSGWISAQTYVIEHYNRKEIMDLTGEHAIGADGFMEFHAEEAALKRMIRDVFMQRESEMGLK